MIILLFKYGIRKTYRDRGKQEDEVITSKARQHYQHLGLPRSAKKAFDKEYSFKAWGTSVDSNTGQVSSPIEKLRQIEVLTLTLLKHGLASKKALQKLVGLYVHPFLHRRECMCVFRHVYQYMDHLPDQHRIPQHIRDEL